MSTKRGVLIGVVISIVILALAGAFVVGAVLAGDKKSTSTVDAARALTDGGRNEQDSLASGRALDASSGSGESDVMVRAGIAGDDYAMVSWNIDGTEPIDAIVLADEELGGQPYGVWESPIMPASEGDFVAITVAAPGYEVSCSIEVDGEIVVSESDYDTLGCSLNDWW